MKPLVKFPSPDATMREWLSPLSSRCGALVDADLYIEIDAPPEVKPTRKRGGPQGTYAPMTKIDHGFVMQKFREGMTPFQIGEILGVRRGTISRIIRKMRA